MFDTKLQQYKVTVKIAKLCCQQTAYAQNKTYSNDKTKTSISLSQMTNYAQK